MVIHMEMLMLTERFEDGERQDVVGDPAAHTRAQKPSELVRNKWHVRASDDELSRILAYLTPTSSVEPVSIIKVASVLSMNRPSSVGMSSTCS